MFPARYNLTLLFRMATRLNDMWILLLDAIDTKYHPNSRERRGHCSNHWKDKHYCDCLRTPPDASRPRKNRHLTRADHTDARTATWQMALCWNCSKYWFMKLGRYNNELMGVYSVTGGTTPQMIQGNSWHWHNAGTQAYDEVNFVGYFMIRNRITISQYNHTALSMGQLK